MEKGCSAEGGEGGVNSRCGGAGTRIYMQGGVLPSQNPNTVTLHDH
jgi:hypothetical protein